MVEQCPASSCNVNDKKELNSVSIHLTGSRDYASVCTFCRPVHWKVLFLTGTYVELQTLLLRCQQDTGLASYLQQQ